MHANWMVAAAVAAGLTAKVSTQQGLKVTRIEPPPDAHNRARFASAIWAGDTLYLACFSRTLASRQP